MSAGFLYVNIFLFEINKYLGGNTLQPCCTAVSPLIFDYEFQLPLVGLSCNCYYGILLVILCFPHLFYIYLLFNRDSFMTLKFCSIIIQYYHDLFCASNWSSFDHWELFLIGSYALLIWLHHIWSTSSLIATSSQCIPISFYQWMISKQKKLGF